MMQALVLSGVPRRGLQPPCRLLWFSLHIAQLRGFPDLLKHRRVWRDASLPQVSRFSILKDFPITRKPRTQSRPHLPDHRSKPSSWPERVPPLGMGTGPRWTRLANSYSAGVHGTAQVGAKTTEKQSSKTVLPEPAKLQLRERKTVKDLCLGERGGRNQIQVALKTVL